MSIVKSDPIKIPLTIKIPVLFIYNEDGSYTDEMRDIYNE